MEPALTRARWLLRLHSCPCRCQPIADRHCAPVMEAFWRARTILLQASLSCADAFRLSTPDFREAAAQVRICGFMSLRDRLNSLYY